MSAEITEKLTAAALRRGQALERSLQIFPQIVIRGVDACGPGRTDMQYSEVVVAHFNQPRHAGRMENPDALGLAGTPGAGPFMALYLRCSGGSVADAAYQTFGLKPASVATAQEKAGAAINISSKIKTTKESVLKAFIADPKQDQSRIEAFNKMHPAEAIKSQDIQGLMRYKQQQASGGPVKDPDINSATNF